MVSYRTSSRGAGPGRGTGNGRSEDVAAEQGVPPAAGPWQPAPAPDADSRAGPAPDTPGQPRPGPDSAQPGGQPAPAPGNQGQPQHHVIRRTRMGGVWLASGLFALVLLFLLIFILENGHKVEISYLGMHGHLPLGVAMLLAAVLGVLLVVIPGTGRIIQLRATARRHRRVDARAQDAASTPTGSAPSAEVPPRSS
jgi:lipopolysaccharide assembly protein A